MTAHPQALTAPTPINTTTPATNKAGNSATVRPAQWADKTALLDMIRALAEHHGDAATLDLPALVHLLKADMPWLRLLVAERNGIVVGYAGLTGGMRLQFGQRVMDLHHLFVRPEHRGTGVGRALINASIEAARTHGCARLTVGTSDSNTAAQSAYIACGFTPLPMTGKRFNLALDEAETDVRTQVEAAVV
ncbi:GNAT family N-acetyltransferase [Celeribacter sp.]|uniref:GNAT family N-acetyltransferase n=1 Tax=Celeribacter sp. TaxID=1890673 RepID=UPI003A95667A